MALGEYSQWRPSAYDPAGAFWPHRQRWLVAPVTRNRDSDFLEGSNWDAQLAAIRKADADGSGWEQVSFDHWFCGWIEILLLRPDSAAAVVGEQLAMALEGYPVLDSEDFSRREWEQYQDFWESGTAAKDLARLLRKLSGVSAAAIDTIGEGDAETVQSWFEALIPSGDYHDSECYPRLATAVTNLRRESDGGRSSLAGLLRRLRAVSRRAAADSV